jgi:hypothetical protein
MPWLANVGEAAAEVWLGQARHCGRVHHRARAIDPAKEWAMEDFEEPVTCSWCGRTHELQESFFCTKCTKARGVCRSCRAEHCHYGPEENV